MIAESPNLITFKQELCLLVLLINLYELRKRIMFNFKREKIKCTIKFATFSKVTFFDVFAAIEVYTVQLLTEQKPRQMVNVTLCIAKSSEMFMKGAVFCSIK